MTSTSPARILFDDPVLAPPGPGAERLEIVAFGKPASQGSKTPIRNKAGRVVGMREDNPKARPWRQDVRALMVEALPTMFDLLDDAVTMTLAVYLQRPKAHYRANGTLK